MRLDQRTSPIKHLTSDQPDPPYRVKHSGNSVKGEKDPSEIECVSEQWEENLIFDRMPIEEWAGDL